MEQYIKKSALVAEIENISDYVDEHWDTDYAIGAKRFADKLQDAIDTLEVKEVDYRPIDNDFERDAVNFCLDNGLNTTPRIAKTIAKHFFELGISVSNKAQKGEEV